MIGWLLFFIHLCSWTIIASKFKDKTTRQCRRRSVFSYFLCFPCFLWILMDFDVSVYLKGCLFQLSVVSFTFSCLCRWFTYLNSDFKKGGWSPEEDVLLCEVKLVLLNASKSWFWRSSSFCFQPDSRVYNWWVCYVMTFYLN